MGVRRTGGFPTHNDGVMVPTPYPELNEALHDLVDGVEVVLATGFVGAYLQGSFAVGGFDEHSDADFAVVTESELTEEQVGALQSLHGRIFDEGKEWSKHLEGSYFPAPTLRNASRAGEELWYLDNGHRSLERSSHCNTVVVRWILREHGVTLAGPESDTLIDPVPVAVLRTEIANDIASWGREILAYPDRYRNRFYQSFIVLNLSRMLHDLRAGSISSKRIGADWAKLSLDPTWSDLIDRAWGGRPDPARSVREPADATDFERTLRFVRYIMLESVRSPEGPKA